MPDDDSQADMPPPAQGADDSVVNPPEPRPGSNPSAPAQGHSVIETTFTGALPDDSRLDQTAPFDDQDVHAHLQDVESSFLAPVSPLQGQATSGPNDDTYLFDVPARQPAHSPTLPPLIDEGMSPRATSPVKNPASESEAKPAQPPSSDYDEPSTSASQYHTADASNTTSELENLVSSPTAAAAARTVSRAISSASGKSQGTTIHKPGADESFDTSTDDPRPGASEAPRQPQTLAVPGVLPRQRRSPSPSKPATDAGNTPGHALRSEQRPKYLRSRNTSQRSSTSSFTNPEDDGDSDATVGQGADYALQSGGAVPSGGLPRNLSNFLSRSISMGSMASGIDEVHDGSGSKGLGPLEPLDEDSGYHNEHEDALKTPKTKGSKPLNAPTDTVIARHVQNVRVPESLAKEYKFKSGLVTPRRPSEFSAAIGTAPSRSGKNMTLKEQSSTIERLSKENFDLKLKVMFLSDRLDKVSEEGVKEMISENVELKTSLAVIQRENKGLRRRVKELEKQLLKDDDDGRPSTAKSGASSEGPVFDEGAQEREEELYYLRERMEEYVVEVDRLRHECMNKEAEKRKLNDAVRSLGERTAGENLGRQDETDVWKDLLEQETARREQADDDNRRLRDEVFRLKQEMASGGGMHHTTNIYNITKRQREAEAGRPVSGLSGEHPESVNGGLSTATTLVEELRREGEQLRHENAELRREVGAQTSMLTSRNREKERLYQEIEDLKMAQRRGNPAPSTIDTLLERSASRAGAHQRSQSRASGTTRHTNPSDEAEREELENQVTDLRDRLNEVKLQNQELQQELDRCMQDFETAIEGKRETEEWAGALQGDLEATMNDLVVLQAERDEALRDQAEMENEFEALRREAQTEIDALEGEADQRSGEIHRLQLDLQDRGENFEALQEEMRKMSDALLRLEDEQDAKLRRIQQLEGELGQANKELEDLEGKLGEANDKANRLGVQQESSQGEIAFLREEQEADKIRIGNLEAEVAGAEQALRDEREQAVELERRLQGERRQREAVANREKEEVQQFVNGLNREASAAKDEARKLRKALSSREVEAAEWKERLMELEGNLRVALGDLNGTRSSLLNVSAQGPFSLICSFLTRLVHLQPPAPARGHGPAARHHQGRHCRERPPHHAARHAPGVARSRVTAAGGAPRQGAAGAPRHEVAVRDVPADAPARQRDGQQPGVADPGARDVAEPGGQAAVQPGGVAEGAADGAEQAAALAVGAAQRAVRERLGARQQPDRGAGAAEPGGGGGDAPRLQQEPSRGGEDGRGDGGRVPDADQGSGAGAVARVPEPGERARGARQEAGPAGEHRAERGGVGVVFAGVGQLGAVRGAGGGVQAAQGGECHAPDGERCSCAGGVRWLGQPCAVDPHGPEGEGEQRE